MIEEMYMSLAIDGVTADECDAIFKKIVEMRGTRRGITVSYHAPIRDEDDED